MSAVRVIVCGALGRMGQEVIRLIQEEQGLTLAAAVDQAGGQWVCRTLSDCQEAADVLIDFSNHAAIGDIMAYCREKKLPAVIATTGHDEAELRCIEEAAQEIPVFQSANMSVGVALLARLVQQAAAIFGGCDVEIIEKHHNRKADAPSGTALLLAESVKKERPEAQYVYGRQGMHKRTPEEIGIHALRMGNVVGEHEVIFSTESQTISLKHEAHDRSLFAEGAVAAAGFLVGKAAGYYHMNDLMGDIR